MNFTGALLNEFKALPEYWWLWLLVTAIVFRILTVLRAK